MSCDGSIDANFCLDLIYGGREHDIDKWEERESATKNARTGNRTSE